MVLCNLEKVKYFCFFELVIAVIPFLMMKGGVGSVPVMGVDKGMVE